jgi:integrase/recombinase XerD
VECSEFDNKQHKIQKIEALNALLFILSTGCRISEVLNLRGEDISASEEKVEVILHRKGGGTDQKEITDSRVKQALIQRIKRQKVFSVTQELLRKVLKRGAKKLGITGGEMNVHSLRHAFATDLLRNGCSLPQVSRALGHANTRITYETYAHLDSADVAHAIRTFGSLSKRDATPAELRKLLLDALNREGFTSSNWLELKKTESGKLELIL